jgi:hypothetical protein
MKYFSKSVFLKAFLITFIYVGLATLTVCSVYPSDPTYGDWSLWALIITLPDSIISFGFRFGNSNDLVPVFIIQLFMFILTYLVVASILLKKEK